METISFDCDCCFSEPTSGYIVNCTGPSTHRFCYGCVCSYMANGIPRGTMHLSCIQKRACSGMLRMENVVELMRYAAEKLSEGSNNNTLLQSIGTIVNCSGCGTRIRKLAFYNYVSCECGTTVCYECGQDITTTVHKHSCNPLNRDREPRWLIGTLSITNLPGSRRSRARSMVLDSQSRSMSLTTREPLYDAIAEGQAYLDNLAQATAALDRMM